MQPTRGLSDGQISVLPDAAPSPAPSPAPGGRSPSTSRTRANTTNILSPSRTSNNTLPNSPSSNSLLGLKARGRSSVGLMDLLLPHPPLPAPLQRSPTSPPSLPPRRPALLVKRKAQTFGSSGSIERVVQPNPTVSFTPADVSSQSTSSVGRQSGEWSDATAPASAPPSYTRFDSNSPEQFPPEQAPVTATDSLLPYATEPVSITVNDGSEPPSPAPGRLATSRGEPSPLRLEPPLRSPGLNTSPFFNNGPVSPCFPSGSSYQGETPTVESSQEGSPFFALLTGAPGSGELSPDREERAELGQWERERIDWHEATAGLETSGGRHGQRDSISTQRGLPAPLQAGSSRAVVASEQIMNEEMRTPPNLRLSMAFSDSTVDHTAVDDFFTPTSTCSPSGAFAFPVRSSSLARRPSAQNLSRTESDGAAVDWKAQFEGERDKVHALEAEVERLKRVVGILINVEGRSSVDLV